jgi:hypothetical protein
VSARPAFVFLGGVAVGMLLVGLLAYPASQTTNDPDEGNDRRYAQCVLDHIQGSPSEQAVWSACFTLYPHGRSQ